MPFRAARTEILFSLVTDRSQEMKLVIDQNFIARNDNFQTLKTLKRTKNPEKPERISLKRLKSLKRLTKLTRLKGLALSRVRFLKG